MNAITPYGAGGGGKAPKGQRSAQEDPNTLRSKTIAYVVDLIGEGEIEGIVGGMKGIYLDETPLQNEDNSFNFSGIVVDTRNGLPQQTFIQGVSADSGLSIPGGEVKFYIAGNSTTFWIGTVSDTTVDAVRIVYQIDALFAQDKSNGDMHGSSVDVIIETSTNGSLWVQVYNDTIQGKTMSPYQRGYRVNKPAGATNPWYVRVRRLTSDPTDSSESRTTRVSGVVGLRDDKFTYPYSALVGITIDTSSFGESLPSRAYKVKGLKVSVPSNYTPATRAYSGTYWNGLFSGTKQWTDNPAWIFYDLLTNPRYGLGDVITASSVDKYALYEIARYCDELVSDGRGGTEARFTFNGILSTREEAYTVLQNLASVFRGMVYWANGTIYATQDSPKAPVQLVAPANVKGGTFNYSSTALKERHSTALVTWNDPGDFYRPAIEVVENPTALARYGYRPIDVASMGCTSRTQAYRLGLWMLLSEQLETEAVNYTASLDHILARPGQIIEIRDPAIDGARLGGRIAPMDDLCIAPGTNWITDATFEDQTPLGWWNVSNAASTSTEIRPAVATVMDRPWRTALKSNSPRLYWGYVDVARSMPVVVGTTYRKGAWLNTQGTTHNCQIVTRYVNSAGVLVASIGSASVPAGSDWTYVSFSFAAPATAAYAQFYVVQSGLTSVDPTKTVLVALPYFGTASPYANNGAYLSIKTDAPITLGGSDTITIAGNDVERPLAGISRTGNVVAITTSTAHGYTNLSHVGRKITVKGVADNSFNGEHVIVNIFSTTVIQVNQVAANASSSGGVLVLQDSRLMSGAITYAAGPQERLLLTTAISPMPIAGAMFVVTASDAPGRKWRITAVRETAPNEYDVVATRYVQEKFDAIEDDVFLAPVTVTRLSSGAVQPPTELIITESIYRANNQTRTRVTLSWKASTDTRVASYTVELITPAGVTTRTGNTRSNSIDLLDVETGFYTFRVYSDTLVQRSRPLQVDGYEVRGKEAPPADVTGFTADPQLAGVDLWWNPVPDLDLVGYEIREAAPSRPGGYTWNVQQSIATTVARDVDPTLGPYLLVITSTDHGFAIGDPVYIEGAGVIAPAGQSVMPFDGAYLVFDVINSTTITILDTKIKELTGVWNGSSGTGTATIRYDNTLVRDLKSTSYFQPLQDTSNHTYLIKARDDSGNYSSNASEVSSRIAAPTDVTIFTATPQEDGVLLRWEAVPGIDVEYEIRAGQSWDLGQTLSITSSTTITMLFPAIGLKIFWVRARSRLGLESPNPLFSQIALENPAWRNFILTSDYQAGSFVAGARRNMEYLSGSNTLSAITNAFTFPTALDNAAWIKANSMTVTANHAVAPDGTTTADRFNMVIGGSAGYVARTMALIAGYSYRYVVQAKPSDVGAKRYLAILFYNTTFGAFKGAVFDVDLGTITLTSTGVTATIKPLANGFYECAAQALCTVTALTTSSIQLRMPLTSTDIFGGGTPVTEDGLIVAKVMLSAVNEPTYGEYFNTLDLGDTFRARNWLDSELVMVDEADSVAWNMATFAWNSEEAAVRQWIAAGANSGATAKRMLSIKTATLATDFVWGIEGADKNTWIGTATYNTAHAGTVTYAALTVTNGMTAVSGAVGASWAVAVTSDFTVRFTARMQDEGSGRVLNIMNNVPFITRAVTVTKTSGQFVLTATDGKTLTIPAADFSPAIEDYITFVVSQSGSTRRFAAYAHRSGAFAQVSRDDAPAQGAINFIQLGPYTYAIAAPAIGNIELYNTGRSTDDAMQVFARNGLAQACYDPYVDLLPGDYDYRYGHLMIAVQAPYEVGRPSISTMRLNIDVADVNEQGTKVISGATWTAVTFAKQFTVAPAVIAFQATGTNVAVAEVQSITKTGCQVRLRDAAGTSVNGTVTYLASGY